MNPIAQTVAKAGIARLIDFAFAAALAGLERAPLVEKVQAMEAEGKTADEITDTLQADAAYAAVESQKAIDEARQDEQQQAEGGRQDGGGQG